LGEKISQSPTVTPKSTTSQSSTPVTHQIKNVTHSSLGGGGDKNPPSRKIESSHKLPFRKKINKKLQEEEGPQGESHICNLSLEDMELNIDIKKVFPNVDQLEKTAHQNPQMEIIKRETFNKEESFVFKSIVFDSEFKNLIIEKRDVNNKRGNLIQRLTYGTCGLPKFPKFTEQLEMV
jgi:hypothetical protein